MKIKLFTILFCSCLLFNGCASTNTQEVNTKDKEDPSNVVQYEGSEDEINQKNINEPVTYTKDIVFKQQFPNEELDDIRKDSKNLISSSKLSKKGLCKNVKGYSKSTTPTVFDYSSKYLKSKGLDENDFHIVSLDERENLCRLQISNDNLIFTFCCCITGDDLNNSTSTIWYTEKQIAGTE